MSTLISKTKNDIKETLKEKQPFVTGPIVNIIHPITSKYKSLGGISGFLGAPSANINVCPDGAGSFQHFSGGSIYYHPNTGACEVHGSIRDQWSSLGWERSFLGYPVTDETATPDGEGRYNHFQGGSVYWSPSTGAFEVHGAIREKYSALGWERSFLGYPVTNETATPDGAGRFNHFQGGSIYWSPSTGAFEVHGDIRALWASLGWETSFLGYPVSDEEDFEQIGGRVSNFQHGQIAWTSAAGAGVSMSSFKSENNSGLGLHPQGLPAGDPVPDVRRRVVLSAHMDITDDETFGSNEHGSADNQTEGFVTNKFPMSLLSMVGKAGGEVRVELKVDVIALTEGDVRISGTAKMFEGTSEESDDLDGTTSIDFAVPRDEFITQSITVRNQDEGGDFSDIRLTVSNFAA